VNCAPITYKVFEECDPAGIENGKNNFTICGFKASASVTLRNVDDVSSGYSSVSDEQSSNFSH
jgi:hypothetical protein